MVDYCPLKYDFTGDGDGLALSQARRAMSKRAVTLTMEEHEMLPNMINLGTEQVPKLPNRLEAALYLRHPQREGTREFVRPRPANLGHRTVRIDQNAEPSVGETRWPLGVIRDQTEGRLLAGAKREPLVPSPTRPGIFTSEHYAA